MEWKQVTLSTVATIQSGAGFPKKKQGQLGNAYPFYKVSDMNSHGNERELCQAVNTISEDTRKLLGAKIFPRGSLVFPKVGGAIGTNKKRLITQDSCVDNNIMGIIPDISHITPDYVFYYMQTVDLLELSNKANPPSIRQTTVQDWHIPLPPLPEQKRIVAILDAAFEGIAEAVTNTEKNLANAQELFDNFLNTVFTQKGDRWVQIQIDDVCESIVDCVNKTAPKVDEPTPFKMIRTTNVRNGMVNLESVNYVTEDVYRIWTRRQIPQRGDVILTREAPMGEVGMILSDDKVFLGQRLVSYRANTAKLNNRFLLYAFQSSELQGQIHALASGSTVQHMRVPDSKNLQLPLPSLSTQESTVSTLDSIREQTKRLEALYQNKLAALAELKQSILQKAFSGELTALPDKTSEEAVA